jgi:hypothetical protein
MIDYTLRLLLGLVYLGLAVPASGVAMMAGMVFDAPARYLGPGANVER